MGADGPRFRAFSTSRRRGNRATHDVEPALVLDEVLDAVGARSGRCDRPGGQPVGRTLVPTAAVLGTVARPGQFDIHFRPTTSRSRIRWERAASRLADGAPVPPVRLLRVGEIYFVVDGHHRVSAARAAGRPIIPATIQPVCTIAAVEHDLRPSRLPVKAAERAFLETVPLPDSATRQLGLPAAADYPRLTELALRWCCDQGLHRADDRGPITSEAAARWWTDEVLDWTARAHPPVPQRHTAAHYLATRL